MKIGLLGFPRTGKSSLFRILTGAAGETAHADRAQLRAGMARVPDSRLDDIAAKFKPKKVTPATLEFWDPVGFQKPDDKESLPYQEIRAAEAFVHVIRAFEDPAVPPPEGGVDPKRDIELMESELLMADLGVDGDQCLYIYDDVFPYAKSGSFDPSSVPRYTASSQMKRVKGSSFLGVGYAGTAATYRGLIESVKAASRKSSPTFYGRVWSSTPFDFQSASRKERTAP